MDWVKLALLCVQLATAFVRWRQQQGDLAAGEAKAVAEASAALAVRAAGAKRVADIVAGMTDAQSDDLIDALGGPNGPGDGPGPGA